MAKHTTACTILTWQLYWHDTSATATHTAACTINILYMYLLLDQLLMVLHHCIYFIQPTASSGCVYNTISRIDSSYLKHHQTSTGMKVCCPLILSQNLLLAYYSLCPPNSHIRIASKCVGLYLYPSLLCYLPTTGATITAMISKHSNHSTVHH